MSLRAVYLYSTRDRGPRGPVHHSQPHLLFSRKFPTVEKRCRIIADAQYVSIPDADLLGRNILEELTSTCDQFLLKGSSEMNKLFPPIYQLRTGAKSLLWPVVILQSDDLVCCTIPLLDEVVESPNDACQLPCVAVAYQMAITLIDHLSESSSEEDREARLKQISLYLTRSCPFGSPVTFNLELSLGLLPPGVSLGGKLDKEMAAWRPHTTTGKNTVALTVEERVRAVLYGRRSEEDEMFVSGQLTATCSLAGTLPELAIKVHSSVPLSDPLVHPSVRTMEKTGESGLFIRLCPPLQPFPVLSYTVNPPPNQEPFVTAQYSLKQSGQGSLLLSMQLTGSALMAGKNCQKLLVTFPFLFPGDVREVKNAELSSGSYSVLKQSKTLTWILGKMPKSKSATCVAEIVLTEEGVQSNSGTPVWKHNATSDPFDSITTFANGINTYATVTFQLSNFSLTRTAVDSVQLVDRNRSAKWTQSQRLAAELVVWNLLGDAPRAAKVSDVIAMRQYASNELSSNELRHTRSS